MMETAQLLFLVLVGAGANMAAVSVVLRHELRAVNRRLDEVRTHVGMHSAHAGL